MKNPFFLSIFFTLSFAGISKTLKSNDTSAGEVRRETIADQTLQEELLHSKKLQKGDEKTYNKILGIVVKMLQPLLDERKNIKGGYERIESAMQIIQQLQKIHEENEYGCPTKIQALNNLLVKAKEQLTYFQNAPKITVDIDSHLTNFEHESVLLIKKMALKNVSLIGGNLSGGLLLGIGLGAAVGSSNDFFGKRKLVVLGQAIPQGIIGISCAAGKYEFISPVKSKLLGNIKGAGDMRNANGKLFGRTIYDNASREYSVDILVRFGRILFLGGLELFALPKRDYKCIRKNLGLDTLYEKSREKKMIR